MISQGWIKGIAVVAVVLMIGLLAYTVQAHLEFIPSEKQEQYSQDLINGVHLVEEQTADVQDGFSQTFSVLQPQDGGYGSIADASQDRSDTVIRMPTPYKSEYVRSVEELRDAWTPKFRKVLQDYNKFLTRTEYARQKAVLYFDNQSRLTSMIINERLRSTFEQRDYEEYAAFRSWELHVEEMTAAASKMMDDFADMDTIIQKQIMSAHFAELSEEFLVNVPQSLLRLNEDVERFRQQSESLYEVFGDNVANVFLQEEGK